MGALLSRNISPEKYGAAGSYEGTSKACQRTPNLPRCNNSSIPGSGPMQAPPSLSVIVIDQFGRLNPANKEKFDMNFTLKVLGTTAGGVTAGVFINNYTPLDPLLSTVIGVTVVGGVVYLVSRLV